MKKKLIGILIINLILAYIGYQIHERITTDLKYFFACMWGATMLGLDLWLLDSDEIKRRWRS